MFAELMNHPVEVAKAFGILVGIAAVGGAGLVALYYLIKDEQ